MEIAPVLLYQSNLCTSGSLRPAAPGSHIPECRVPRPSRTVSVVTPFYNTAEYLAECIESVLAQTLGDFEYVLADNASTDGSTDIASEYARRDPRIRFLHFDEHLPQVPNYNRALREADPSAKYCKVVQADDLILPRCLEEMACLADTDPEIGIVGSYTIVQDRVFLDGLDFYERIVDGDEVLRRYLHDGPYLFGSPTTHLYRMQDVKARYAFYSETSVFEDTEVAVELVLGRKLGFVHQVLSFVRTSNDSLSGQRDDYHIDALTRRVLIEKYGQRVLDDLALRRIKRRLARRHHRVLGEAFLLRRPSTFWDLHLAAAAEAGFRTGTRDIVAGSLVTILRWLANPETTLRRLWTWVTGGGKPS